MNFVLNLGAQRTDGASGATDYPGEKEGWRDDAAEGSERVQLNERLWYRERLLEGLRQALAEVERDTFILSVERDIKRLR
jgi:hypothetical protein